MVNNTEVIPGRLVGKRKPAEKPRRLFLTMPTQGRTPAARAQNSDAWSRPPKQPKPGTTDHLSTRSSKPGWWTARRVSARSNFHLQRRSSSRPCYRIGKVPLPPYIRRGGDGPKPDDRLAYQTVYASSKGAIAAPTAGLHFTRELMDALAAQGGRDRRDHPSRGLRYLFCRCG